MNTAKDEYTPAGKRLASEVQRLRGWVGKDESRQVELADALLALTAHRLQGHQFAEAAPDAQESVVLTAKLLAANGPIGPYTPETDAARLVSATVHVATIQHAAGASYGATATLATAEGLLEALAAQGVRPAIAAETCVWALIAQSKSALVAGDAARANALADAALAWGAQPATPEGMQPIDALAAVADARWAGGRADESLGASWRAAELYDELAEGVLAAPKQGSPGRIARLAQPALRVLGDLADRLVATGDAETGLVTRRRLVDLFEAVAARRSTVGASDLARARHDLAADLALVGRQFEADELLDDKATTDAGKRERRPLGPWVDWAPLAPDATFAPSATQPVDTHIEREKAEQARAEAHRLEAERAEAARAEAERQAEEARLRAEREAAAAEAARIVAETEEAARAERERAEELAREQAEREAVAESQRRRAERIEAHRLEAERRELEERAALGEPDAIEALAALDAPAEVDEQPEAAEQVRRAAEAAERERLAADRARAEAEAARAADPVAIAQERLADARMRGHRREVFAASSAVVDALRGTGRDSELLDALQDLATAQRQAGDWWGSRKPAKEAKDLAKRLGR